ncbi:MAG TPA: DUF2071 domain-containing protein [Ktedonobacterales bacterium]|nr:DUF2071 domain-containing protein [Ktedonobacterales bacterium]
MQAAEILRAAPERPWPTPTRPWAMTQVWRDLLFAHWPIPAPAMASLLPPGLTLDTWAGEAWIGVVPFRMTDVTLRGLPQVPPFNRLLETNVRTYVTLDDRPGVYFFSLDADNPVMVEIARVWYHLNYFNARFACGFPYPDDPSPVVRYHVARTDRRARPGVFAGYYQPIGAPFTATPGSIEEWLTARYCLYSVDRAGRISRGEIHHQPWPLQLAEGEIEVNTLASSHGLTLPDTAPLLHFARRLDVVAWPITPIAPNSAPTPPLNAAN